MIIDDVNYTAEQMAERYLFEKDKADRLAASLAAVEIRAHSSEGLLAGLADCINQELRENGPADVPQVSGYLGAEDMRHFVRLLVDLVKHPRRADGE